MSDTALLERVAVTVHRYLDAVTADLGVTGDANDEGYVTLSLTVTLYIFDAIVGRDVLSR